MNAEDLKEILAKHKAWLNLETGGSRADLRGADLRGADLRGAVLRGAVLSRADLRGADLSGAVLRGADLRGAVLSGAVLSGAVLSGADGEPISIPTVENIDQQILHVVEGGDGELDMGSWHSCETTHCRAGWAVHLAGKDGYALERAIGPSAAGALIYHASAGYVPNFFASTEEALADIRARAAT